MEEIEGKITKVENEIKGVEAEIKEVAQKLEERGLSDKDVAYLRKKEGQLRDKEKQLRDKEKQLRDKEVLVLQQQRTNNKLIEQQQDGDEIALLMEGVSLKPTKSEDAAAPIPFVNREVECKKLASILLANYTKRMKRVPSTGAQSQDRLTLATSAQMFGSGKSTFGEKFLSRFQSQDWLQQQLGKNYGKEAITWLNNLDYVGLDFRSLNQSLTFVGAIRVLLFKTLLGKLSEEQKAKIQKITLSKLVDIQCSTIVQEFEQVTNSRFFIHLDEVSAVEQFMDDTTSMVTLMYRMWTEICLIHNSTAGSEVFCSGRSLTLYSFGRGYLKADQGARSPEDANCILLDPLKESNVEEIFSQFLDDIEPGFIPRVHHLTAGVPRFVTHAVDFFTDRVVINDADPIDYAERTKKFLHDSSDFVKYLETNASGELHPLRGFEAELKNFYVELVRVAALRLPLRMNDEIDGEVWGLSSCVMTLDVCSMFPLYLQRSNELDDEHFLVIPPLVLDEVARETPDPRLPFWSSLYKACPVQAQAQSSGELLETMVQHVLRLRISEELRPGPRLLGQCLPFFRGSIIGGDTFNYQGFQQFPKITKCSTKDRTRSSLRKFFDNPSTAGFSNVHPDDLAEVVVSLQNGFFYVPLPQSASVDLLFITDNMGAIVEMQFKNGKQNVNTAMVAKELKKSCCFCCCDKKVVFVMIGLTTLEDNLPPGERVMDQNDNTVALRYGNGSCFNSVVVPPNLEVIVVLERGLESFLTKSNVDILRKKHQLNLNEMVAATMSPSKRPSR